MYVNKKLCLVLVKFFMIVVCKAEYDNFDKMSSCVRCDCGTGDENCYENEVSDDSPFLNKEIKTVEIDGSSSSVLFDFIETHMQAITVVVSEVYLLRLLRNMRSDILKYSLIALCAVIILDFTDTSKDPLVNVENMEQVPFQCQPVKMRSTDEVMDLVSPNCEKYNAAQMNNNPKTKTFIYGISQRAVALIIDIAIAIIKIFFYLPSLILWVVQSIHSLDGHSRIGLVCTALLLYIYFNYDNSSRAKHSGTRRYHDFENKQWIPRCRNKSVVIQRDYRRHNEDNRNILILLFLIFLVFCPSYPNKPVLESSE